MDLIHFFGDTVTKHLYDHPAFTRNFVRLGYGAQQLMLNMLPNPSLLPSQQYAAKICLKYIREPMNAPERAALVNLFMPCELLHAMDISPLCAEGVSAFLSGGKCDTACLQKADEMGIPDTYCSFHKTLLGAVYTGLIRPPLFIASTNIVCDANFSTFNAIAAHCKIPKFLIDVPSDEHEDAVMYVTEQLSMFVDFMEELLGCNLSWERFMKAVANTNRSVASHERFLSALETRCMPTTATFEMYRLLTSHILLGTDETAEFYDRLASDAQGCEISSRKRILWCHVMPFGMDTMDAAFFSNGAYQLLPTDLHYDAMLPLDPQQPLHSIASRLVANHLNGRVEKRIDALLAMAKRLHADGAVMFCHWGCKASNGSAFLLRDALQSEGIPAIVLDGDACDRRNMSEGQFSTRMQAFFEMLEGTA